MNKTAFVRFGSFQLLGPFAYSALGLVGIQSARADCPPPDLVRIVSISINECRESDEYPGSLRVRGDIRERLVVRHEKDFENWDAEPPSNQEISDAAATLHPAPSLGAQVKITCAGVSDEPDKLWYVVPACYDTGPRPSGEPLYDLRAYQMEEEKQLLDEIAKFAD